MSLKLLQQQALKLENKKTDQGGGERLKYEMILHLKKFLLSTIRVLNFLITSI